MVVQYRLAESSEGPLSGFDTEWGNISLLHVLGLRENTAELLKVVENFQRQFTILIVISVVFIQELAAQVLTFCLSF